MLNIVAMSTLCADIFDETGEIRPGGEALNFAAVASKYLHVHMSIIGAIGNDECGSNVLAVIANKRIDKSSVR